MVGKAEIESEISEIYSILGNTCRRKIILLLGNKGPTTFTELKRHLKTSVGTLYYNLDQLRGYISQDKNKRYFLTPKGLKTFKLIKRESSRIEEIVRPKHIMLELFERSIGKILLPESFFTKMYNNYLYTIILALISVSIGVSGNVIAYLKLNLLEYSLISIDLIHKNYVTLSFFSYNIVLPLKIWISLSILKSWIFITLLSEILSYLLGSKTHRPEFILVILVAMFPIFLYPYLYLIFPQTFIGYIVLTVIYRLILQVFTIGFLTISISIFRGLSIERSFIVTFIIFYLSYTLSSYIQL